MSPIKGDDSKEGFDQLYASIDEPNLIKPLTHALHGLLA